MHHLLKTRNGTHGKMKRWSTILLSIERERLSKSIWHKSTRISPNDTRSKYGGKPPLVGELTHIKSLFRFM